ncbi:hypothetical protein [Nocardioides insulae]|uniref:hypothetical protein n=1 Tax=Nocardioides insulae TaxID=394734 RepID=UPI0003F5FC36|nr:hypothetical protein [Nocardioides insulae]
MFGPLPALHRALVVAVTLLAGIACGVWLGRHLPVSEVSAGALGVMAGILIAYLVVRDAHHGEHEPRRVRSSRRHAR